MSLGAQWFFSISLDPQGNLPTGSGHLAANPNDILGKPTLPHYQVVREFSQMYCNYVSSPLLPVLFPIHSVFWNKSITFAPAEGFVG